jgi:hypothetical protein
MIRTAVLATLVAIMPLAYVNGAIIDLFETPHSAESTVTAPPPQGVGSLANPTDTAIGVERDLFVNKTSGADDERLRARVNPIGATKLRIDADAEVLGSVYITWDGVDGDPNPFTGIDFDGLQSFDLTAGANAFELVVSFSDIEGPIHFSVFDATANNASSVATATLNVPSGIAPNTPTVFSLPFASFTGTTSALSDAGAILMEVEGSSGGWDLNIVSIETVPEPASILLFGLGIFVAIKHRWRKR